MKEPAPKPAPRVITADRRQLQLVSEDLESLLEGDHTARAVWSFVEKMDLRLFYEPIKSVEGTAGRDATDPKVLVAIWLYAAMDGVGSAREIERLTESEDAYRWIRGGVPLNHHMLSDFRVGHQAALDGLLTQSIAALLRAGVVTLRRVAQDGTKIRANAGSGSFRRELSLRKCLIAAQEQLEWLRRDAAKPDTGKHARALSAQKRAAEEKMARVQRALEALPALQAKQDDKKETRASMTDPDARIMKMGDNGFRPAYNVQFATDADGLAVVGVAVSQSPADSHQMPPMLEQIQDRTGAKPEAYFVDNGYTDHRSIETMDAAGVTVYAPLQVKGPKPKDGRPPHDPSVPTAKDSEAIVHYRLRMATPEAKQEYRIRGQVAELTNADVKGRQGLTQVLVRGLPKVTSIILWSAIALNLTRMLSSGLL